MDKEQFLSHITSGNLEEVKKYIEQFSFNEQRELRDTALKIGGFSGQFSICKYVLESSNNFLNDLNLITRITNYNHATEFCIYLYNLYFEFADKLPAKARFNYVATTLDDSVNFGNKEIVQYILEDLTTNKINNKTKNKKSYHNNALVNLEKAFNKNREILDVLLNYQPYINLVKKSSNEELKKYYLTKTLAENLESSLSSNVQKKIKLKV